MTGEETLHMSASELPSENEVGINFTGIARGMQGDFHVYERGRMKANPLSLSEARDELREILENPSVDNPFGY